MIHAVCCCRRGDDLRDAGRGARIQGERPPTDLPAGTLRGAGVRTRVALLRGC